MRTRLNTQTRPALRRAETAALASLDQAEAHASALLKEAGACLPQTLLLDLEAAMSNREYARLEYALACVRARRPQTDRGLAGAVFPALDDYMAGQLVDALDE